ncbi:MAG: hypothetical protein V4530_08100 [Pseudomonadota bacterium]
MRIWMILIALLTLPVTVAAQEQKSAAGPSSHSAIAQARVLLRDTLLDYEGSQYRDFHVVRSVNSNGVEMVALCGLLNGRNTFGGLTGWLPISVVVTEAGAGPAVYFFEGADPFNRVAYMITCPTKFGSKFIVEDKDVTAELAPKGK